MPHQDLPSAHIMWSRFRNSGEMLYGNAVKPSVGTFHRMKTRNPSIHPAHGNMTDAQILEVGIPLITTTISQRTPNEYLCIKLQSCKTWDSLEVCSPRSAAHSVGHYARRHFLARVAVQVARPRQAPVSQRTCAGSAGRNAEPTATRARNCRRAMSSWR